VFPDLFADHISIFNCLIATTLAGLACMSIGYGAGAGRRDPETWARAYFAGRKSMEPPASAPVAIGEPLTIRRASRVAIAGGPDQRRPSDSGGSR
jgi:hypothetical protein